MHNSSRFGRMLLQPLALNQLIQFGDHLLVDHPAIDGQHKAIIDLGVKVFEDWRGEGGLDALRPGVEKLSNLMHSHFAYEERVLDDIGYEDLKNHAAEHRTLRDKLSSMHGQLRCYIEDHEGLDGQRLAPGWSVMQFIFGVTQGHIANSDMNFSRALLENRAADDFWRGADAVYQRCLETGKATAARSRTRLQARLTRRAANQPALT